jgi:hypothetical protein
MAVNVGGSVSKGSSKGSSSSQQSSAGGSLSFGGDLSQFDALSFILPNLPEILQQMFAQTFNQEQTTKQQKQQTTKASATTGSNAVSALPQQGGGVDAGFAFIQDLFGQELAKGEQVRSAAFERQGILSELVKKLTRY